MKLLIATAMIASLGFSLTASAGPVNVRQNHQHARIEQGIAGGQLTPREASSLIHEQREIRAMEARFKSDGEVKPAEFARLKQRQEIASRRIYRQKHDPQQRE